MSKEEAHMSKEVENLQMKELGDVKALVDEDKIQKTPADQDRRFGQLLEMLWRQDEDLQNETESELESTTL